MGEVLPQTLERESLELDPTIVELFAPWLLKV